MQWLTTSGLTSIRIMSTNLWTNISDLLIKPSWHFKFTSTKCLWLSEALHPGLSFLFPLSPRRGALPALQMHRPTLGRNSRVQESWLRQKPISSFLSFPLFPFTPKRRQDGRHRSLWFLQLWLHCWSFAQRSLAVPGISADSNTQRLLEPEPIVGVWLGETVGRSSMSRTRNLNRTGCPSSEQNNVWCIRSIHWITWRYSYYSWKKISSRH